MSKLFNRAGMTTATTGTGTVTLGSAVTDSTNGDFQTFAGAGAANLDVVNYLITDGNAWELGTGTYTSSGTTLSRTLGSSSTGSLLSLSGSAKVYSVPFATDIKTPNLTDFSTTTPTTPVDGATLFSRFRAGRHIAGQQGPTNRWFEFQPSLATMKFGSSHALGGSAITNNNVAAPNISGTATVRSLATTNLLTQTRRVGYVPASAAINQPTGWNGNGANDTIWRGNAASLGGFVFCTRFGFNSFTAGNRIFVGVGTTLVAGGSADPSAALNIIGIGQDAADTNFQVMTNDGSGTATKTDTGFAPAAAKLYEVRVFVAPNGSSIYVSIERIDDGTLYEATVSSDLPVNSGFMFPTIAANTGTQTTGAQIDILGFYIEADY